LQGWHSPSGGVLNPSPAVNFEASGNSAQYATIFTFGKNVSVDVNNNKLNSENGKLVWEEDGKRKTLTLEKMDGIFEVKYKSNNF
jgi:hypothetical protein